MATLDHSRSLDVRPVLDLHDPELEVYRHLKDRHLKCREGLFVAEGLEVVRRLLHSRLTVHSLLVTPRKLERLAGDIQPGVPVYVADLDRMQEVAGFAIHRGAVACGHRPAPATLADAMTAAERTRLVLVLENICDAQNVGVVLRNAAAFGVGLVVLSGCCDPFYRRAIRVSMGNVFRIPLYVTERLIEDLEALRRHLGYELIAATTTGEPVRRTDPDQCTTGNPTQPDAPIEPRRIALLFGSEGDGLSSRVLDTCDRRMAIPMAAGCDSLNVAVASGILLYAHAKGAVCCRHADRAPGYQF